MKTDKEIKFRKEIKENIQRKKEWNKQIKRVKELEYLGGFFYDAIGGEMFSIFIYDKKIGKVFAGTLEKSNYSKKDIVNREYLRRIEK